MVKVAVLNNLSSDRPPETFQCILLLSLLCCSSFLSSYLLYKCLVMFSGICNLWSLGPTAHSYTHIHVCVCVFDVCQSTTFV